MPLADLVGMASPHNPFRIVFSLLAVPGGEQISVIEVSLSVMLVVVLSIAPSALHRVIFAYIWTRCRSLGVATVYHSAVDTTRDSLLILVGSGPFNSIRATLDRKSVV